ncbi:MAG: lipopolysaccharide transport periplasmic protein LptA [Deltaproteobacteria bacterium]|nr:lipopolysaccharide transport periplasmic protein LptA [Deltaproteobacteria bacterium]
MNYIKYRSVLYIIPLLMLFHPSFVLPKAPQEEILKTDTSGPIVIKSNTFEIDNKKNIVTFTGDVNARRDNLTINCQKLLLYYHNQPGIKDPEKGEMSIDRIIATGEVKIRRSDVGLATAEKAVYYQDDEKVVLTGKPVVKQGDDFVEGSMITLFLKENRSIVEGSEDNKARAVIFPKSRKR